MDIQNNKTWCFSKRARHILLVLACGLSTTITHQNSFAEETGESDFLSALADVTSAETDSEKFTKGEIALKIFKENIKMVSGLAGDPDLEKSKSKALLIKTRDLNDELTEFQKFKLQFLDPETKEKGDLLLSHYKVWQKKAARLLGRLCITVASADLADVDITINNRQAMSDGVCENELSQLDKSLRKTVKLLQGEISNKQKQLLSGKLSAEELGKDIREAQQTIKKIKSVVAVSEIEGELFTTHADYPAFSMNIYGGVESQTVNNIANPDIPRLGLMIYQQSRGKKEKSVHFYSNFLLTGSAEASEAKEGEEPKDAKAEQSLETNFNAFYAYHGFSLDNLYVLVGPVISLGVLKSDGDTHTSKKRYIGIRSALNPETYMEILYGTTSGLNSRRLELRMQGPISRFENGSRIFIGATFNLGINKRVDEEPDSVNIYLTWHIPFGDVWNLKNSD